MLRAARRLLRFRHDDGFDEARLRRRHGDGDAGTSLITLLLGNRKRYQHGYRKLGLKTLLRLVGDGTRLDGLLRLADRDRARAPAAGGGGGPEEKDDDDDDENDDDSEEERTRRLDALLDEVGAVVEGLDESDPLCELVQRLVATVEAPTSAAVARRAAALEAAFEAAVVST